MGFDEVEVLSILVNSTMPKVTFNERSAECTSDSSMVIPIDEYSVVLLCVGWCRNASRFSPRSVWYQQIVGVSDIEQRLCSLICNWDPAG